MRDTTVMLSELTARGSWDPHDFLYRTGDRVRLADGRRCVVVGQDEREASDREARVSERYFVPGSNTEFALSTPFRIRVYDIERASARREARDCEAGR